MWRTIEHIFHVFFTFTNLYFSGKMDFFTKDENSWNDIRSCSIQCLCLSVVSKSKLALACVVDRILDGINDKSSSPIKRFMLMVVRYVKVFSFYRLHLHIPQVIHTSYSNGCRYWKSIRKHSVNYLKIDFEHLFAHKIFRNYERHLETVSVIGRKMKFLLSVPTKVIQRKEFHVH